MTTENGFGSSYATSPTDDPSRMGGVSNEPKSLTDHELDNIKNQKLLNKLQQWYDYEWEIQSPNRYQMALDCDYYDGMQWTEEEAQILINRGQAPLVFNEIKSTVDWMIGTERRARIDHKILPRKDDPEANKNAENKSALLKYLSDVNKTPFQRSMAFENSIKAGVGWLEVGVRGDPTDELNYTRNEDWRNCLPDSTSTEMDGSDMRYFFRSRWLDEDIAIAYFPERKSILESACINADSITMQDDEDIWYMGARVTAPGQDYATGNNGRYMPYAGSILSNSTRSRVKLKECWYKNPVLMRKFSGGDFENEVFDSKKPEHVKALQGGYSLYDKLQLEVRCAIFCSAGLLFDGKSPYKHNRIPFIPVWCYRRKRDNQPYGIIRGLRDPQDDLNKRRSKAQWIMSSVSVVGDKDAVDDWDELREEVARPDSVIAKKKGASLEIKRDGALAQEHLSLMEIDSTHIRNAGGVNNENLGRQSNASSGIALQERKESGTVTTTAPFDNLHYAVQLVGEMELSNIEQFYTQEKTIRILGERNGVKFKDINKPDGNGNILNDITAYEADFIITEQDYRSSLRQAMFESLFDIVGRLAQMNPQVALNLLDLVVEMADLPNKDELVARIRKINGQSDPEQEETPEQMAQREGAEKQAKELGDLQNKLALKTQEAAIAETEATTAKLQTQAMNEKINAIYSALQAAGVVAASPATAPIADEILKGAGYKDTSIDENQAVQQAQQTQPQATPVQARSPVVPTVQPQSADIGAEAGIETPQNDGIQGAPQ